MLIHKSHIGEFTQFTTNIQDRYINPDIEASEVEDARPLLGDAMVNDILVISDYNPQAWAVGTTYSALIYVVYNDKVYKWLQAGTGQDPETAAAYWELSPLGTFWWNYVRPWIVFKTMEKFSSTHGVNITQSGMRTNESTQDFPIDGGTRATVVGRHRKSAAVRENKLLTYLKSVNWTINTVVYEVDCTQYKKTTGSFSIRAAGKKRST